jgi:hypothetical protein
MPAVEFALLEIAGAAERNGTGMTKQLPLPLRRLDRAIAGPAQSTPSPATRTPSTKSKAKATKWVISAIDARFAARLPVAPRPALM